MTARALIALMLISSLTYAAPRVECPTSCVNATMLDSRLNVVIRCTEKIITVRLDDGRERVVPISPSNCRAVPELVQVLASATSVARAKSTSLRVGAPKTAEEPAGAKLEQPAPRSADSPGSRDTRVTASPSAEHAGATAANPMLPESSAEKASADADSPDRTTPESSARQASATDANSPNRTSLESPKQESATAPSSPNRTSPESAEQASATVESPESSRPAKHGQQLAKETTSSKRVLAVDLGGGFGAQPLVGVGVARVGWWPWSRLGFIAEGGFTSSATIALPNGSATTERQFAGIGATASLRPITSWGPRASLWFGAERVVGRGQGLTTNRSDEALGVIGSLSLEWNQPLFMGLYARAMASGLARPATWSVQVAPNSEVAWPLFGVQATISLGWAFSFGVSEPLQTLELKQAP